MRNTPPPFFESFSIKSVLKNATKILQETSSSAELDAELLLAYCLNKSRTYLYTWPEIELNKQQIDCYETLIAKRQTDYPVAYLLGTKAFWTLDLLVSPDVLIPRPETELLVEVALNKIRSLNNPRILDLGTGSGAIALALAFERPDTKVFATDFSRHALQIARQNALRNHLAKRVTFFESDWFSNIADNTDEKFDLIVSNPPYIALKDPHLLETIRYEPQEALVAEEEGMRDIKCIIEKSPFFLAKNGWLVIEHGYNQAKKCQTLFSHNSFIHCTSITDLSGLERVTLAQL